MSDVIDFTQALAKREQKRLDELVEEKENEEDFIANVAFSVGKDLVDIMPDFEYDVFENPECVRDLMLVIEGVRSMMHRIRGEKYPIHSFSDTLFEEIVGDRVTSKEFLENFIENVD